MVRSIKQMKVYVIDDHQLIREGLSSLIAQDKSFIVSGSSDSCSAALLDLSKEEPDIIIVDITLKDGNGIELVKNICSQYPSAKCLVLSMHDESTYAERAVKAGAFGYVMKQEASDLILSALHDVKDGNIYLSDKMKSKLLNKFIGARNENGQQTPDSVLSDRELEIFSLTGEGKSSREIAQLLGLSIKTIEAHKEHIREKLSIDSSNRLIVEAATWRLKNDL